MKCSRSVLSALVALALLVLATAARAATFNVDTTVDDPAKKACDATTPDDCSLRGAVIAASALTEASTINLPAGTYPVTQSVTCTRKASGGGTQQTTQVALCLTNEVTIQGAGAATTIIDGLGQRRPVLVSFGATAELRGVTVTNGIGEQQLAGGATDGGAIRNHGTLRLTDSVVSTSTLPPGFGGATGAGIYNAAALTLLRTTVTNNISLTSSAGGGIYNDGFQGAVLTVVDSLISNNTIGSSGGGIANAQGGVVTIIGSTIAGNTANQASGGGIFSSRFTTLKVTNSTISGNHSGSSGGGISQSGSMELNNVTITANTSGTNGNGQGGGIDNSLGTSLTLRNTIIAGNIDLAGTPKKPDCDARTSFASALISQGYNLIGNTTGCDITGDLTGNVTGVDAKLGVLLNNGGFSPTHALGTDSPAVDAGNPAAPGNGGAACAATDQRGFVRPLGAQCDIGAFENDGAFMIGQVTPKVGGDIGSVTAVIAGRGIVDGATVKLVRSGEADIAGSTPYVDPGGTAITTTFDLVGKARGAWDVVVTNPDTASLALPGGFTIEVGRAADLWIDIVGNLFRLARSPFTIFYGNRGNVDAVAVPFTLNASGAYGLSRRFPITPPPALPEQFAQGIWDGVGITVTAGTHGDFTNAPLLLPVVPAGFTGILQIGLQLPPNAPEGTIFADIGSPFVTGSPDPQIVASMVAGAREFSASVFGIAIPETLVVEMSQYVTAQLEALVTTGRHALVASNGTSSQVYSLVQLQVDVALFGAGRAVAQQASATPMNPLAVLAEVGRTFAPLSAMFEPVAALAQKQSAPSCKAGGVLPQGVSCDSKDETIKPGSDDGNCAIEDMTKYLRGLGPRPDCTLSPPGCGAIGSASLYTLKRGGQVCRGPGCKNPGSPDCFEFPITPLKAKDPNDKAGSLGKAAEQFVLGDAPFSYVVHFENVPTATAPAAIVVVTDPLDVQHLDLETFSLGPISFSDVTLVPSPGMIGYSASVDLRPAQDLVVTVNANLDKATGVVTWRFDSIDPATGQSTEDPAVGLLPPNVDPPAGEGLVAFSVRPKPGLATATSICNQASIVFDDNDPLATENWCNTIDVTPPASSVQALASTQSTATFPVQWGGTDAGAGIGTYSVFVAENGGPFTPFVTETAETSAMFPGTVGKVYAFYSVARDLVGNLEAAPPAADAETAVGASPGPHDLAITAIKVPTIKLTSKKPSITKAIKVQIQNRGPGSETIDSPATLANLVTATLTSSGGCPAPAALIHVGKPQKKLPFTIKKKGKLTVLFDVVFDCANDPEKGKEHGDYQVAAHLNPAALGIVDAHAADDDCPRQVTPPGALDPFPDGKLVDKGCGSKKADKTLGDPVLVDVIAKP